MIRARIRVLVAAFALATIAATAGCTPSAPAPSPTPSGFADEAEAFAAAEETYRAYVDALNRVDLSDPATFEDVYRWTTGDLNASDREGLSRYHAEGFTVSGETVIDLMSADEWSPSAGETTLNVCLNVSDIDLVDPAGVSQVSPGRVDVQSLRVSLIGGARDDLRISNVAGREGEPLCAS